MPTSTWDFENMCVAIALPSGTRNTFTYDGARKRRRAEDSAGLVRFVHDGENVLLETDGAGATQVSYTLEPAGYGNLISQRRGSTSSWHHFDALGSTDRLTDAGESELASYVQTASRRPRRDHRHPPEPAALDRAARLPVGGGRGAVRRAEEAV